MPYPERIIAVTVGGERWQECQETYPGVIPFNAITPENMGDLRPRWMHRDDWTAARRIAIPMTFHRLAVHLTQLGAGLETLVIQDDVRFFKPIPDYSESTVFGRLQSEKHICPQAWSFEPNVYYTLAEIWENAAQVCTAWYKIVRDFKIVPVASDREDPPPT